VKEVHKMGFKHKIIFIVVLLIVILSGFIFLNYYGYLSTKRGDKIVIEIPKGLGLKDIALKLEDAGIIRSGKLFILTALIRGDAGKLKAGEYEFQIGDPLNLIIEKLLKGDVLVRKITIPEGLTIKEIAELLERKDIVSKEAFFEKANSSAFIKELLGVSLPSFEGYLFPDSYLYKKGITPEELIRMMVSRFKEVYKPLRVNSGMLNLTDHEVVTIASIIEKETGNPSERPLISAVFYNRLRLGMRLESDPTVIYGIGDFNGSITKKDLRTETKYNTYMVFGLPPGPISNPGKDSLQATLNPANVNYLYFVSKGDGTHEFSSNYLDHQRGVMRYQKQSVSIEKIRQ
jgi:UPF0755 protein